MNSYQKNELKIQCKRAKKAMLVYTSLKARDIRKVI